MVACTAPYASSTVGCMCAMLKLLLEEDRMLQNDTRRYYVYCCYDTQPTITSIISLLLLLLLMLILAFLPLFASIG